MSEWWLNEFIGLAISGSVRVAVDIGANEGEWSYLLSRCFDHVIAVEPDPRAYQSLESSAAPNTLAVNAAASDSDGEATLYVRSNPLQTSLLAEHPIGAGDCSAAPIVDSFSIKTITLNSLRDTAYAHFGTSHIDFVKIDVEGAEDLVLAGATPELFRATKFLIEVHNREREVGEQLRRLCRSDVRIMRHPAPGAHKKHFWIYVEGT